MRGRRFTVGSLIAVVLVMLGPVPALAADPVTALDLIESSEAYSGLEVTVTGELVGDYGRRRNDSTWVQLNDDPYAFTPLREGGNLAGTNIGIGVRLPERLVSDLDPPGGYSRKGPLVSVTGIWRHHDPARGGESYLDATSLRVEEPGRPLTDDASIAPRLAAAVLLWAAFAAVWVRHRRPR